jgi:hypothetical protein
VETVGPPILALVVAALVTASELITAKYPRTYFLVLRDRFVYLYVLIYGAIAFGAAFGFDALVSAGKLKLEGLGLASPWVRALVLGVAVKSLLHINLFTVTVGSQPVPVGMEMLVLLFEPWLLRTILLNEFNAVRAYLQPRATKYPNLAQVKATIIANVPPTIPAPERTDFINEVSSTTTVIEAMEVLLRFLGSSTLERVFP